MLGTPTTRSQIISTVVAAGIAVTSTLAMAFPAAAQQAFTREQCSQAQSLVIAMYQRNQGRLSRGFIDSVNSFVGSGCDLNTPIVRNTDADESAFADLRVRLVALRTASATPTTLTK